MTPTQERGLNRGRPLRLWPGVAIAVVQCVVVFGIPAVMPDQMLYAMMGGLALSLAMLVWWVFFSRVHWLERLGAIALIVLAEFGIRQLVDKSIATAGMGMMLPILSIPVAGLALPVWAVLFGRLPAGTRRVALALTILVAAGYWVLLRTDGITGSGHSQLAWRWSKTPEQRLLARSSEQPPPPPSAAPPALPAPETRRLPESAAPDAAKPAAVPVALPKTLPAAATPSTTRTVSRPAEWPGFRGPHRDSVVTGVRIKTDWGSAPPVQLWRRAVGPGWSSFAVGDGLIYTQEQRGEFEVVACYNGSNGEPVWSHRDSARFWESNGGPGPRGTPSLADGFVYSLGATGILNALDARTGAVVWTRSAASDTGAKMPGWGFTSSPLIVGDLLIVAASGRLAAYDRATGSPRWHMANGGVGYSSPHLATIDGVTQVLLMNNAGTTSVEPSGGKVLWTNAWPGAPILQPAVTADGIILLATSGAAGGEGTRRLAVTHGAGGWSVEEKWTSAGLKPYFNDTVIHDGYAYGFDSGILACIDIQDGKRKWKGGRYGHGQMLLLSGQDLLLVLSEEGELALVRATPGQFTEITRSPAMDGKTWNHPVLVGDLLLVRNGQEMAAFRLPLAGD